MGLTYLKNDFRPILLTALGLFEAWVEDCRVKIFTCENLIFDLVQIGVDIPEKLPQPPLPLP